MTPLDAALNLIARGWNPVPVEYRSKKPALGEEWHKVIITAQTAPQYFNGRDMNIGGQLGAPSRGLTDADLDCAEAIAIAPYILPRTSAIFGRPSKRNSHWLFYTTLADTVDNAALTFDDPLANRNKRRDGRLIELRIGGCGKGAQTVMPGSIHTTGEEIRWEENGEPAAVDGVALRRQVATIAAYSLLARYWPETGSGHHDTARVVGGFLARLGHPPPVVRCHVEAIAKAADSARWKELARTAKDAAEAYAAGGHTFGILKLPETFGNEIADKVAQWLNYQGEPGDDTQQEQGQQKPPPIFSWDDPDSSILEDRRGDLPVFPMYCLSEGWQVWAGETAHATGTTAAHVVVPLITIASGIIGVARQVQASRSWKQPMSLWGGIVGLSGSGKTPGLSAITRALAVTDDARRMKLAEAKRAHDEKRDIAATALKAWKKALAKAIEKGTPRPPRPDEAIDPGPYVMPRLWITDITIERAAQLLEARGSGLVYVQDELAGLFANMSRYSNGEDRAFWLQSWNGDAFRQERVGREPISIDYLTISIVGGFQPDKLSRAFEGDHDGMYGRMLFAWPEEAEFRELNDDVAEVEPAIVNALSHIVRLGDPDADAAFAPRSIPISGVARDIFEDVRKLVAEDKGQLDGRERDWWCKVPAHVLRLAGTLQILDWALDGGDEPAEIDARHMTAAVRLVLDYFWPHSRAALRQIDRKAPYSNIRRVVRWIKTRDAKTVSREDIRHLALLRALNADETHALLMELTRAGWLRLKLSQPGPSGGRPVIRWEVNPKLRELRM